MTNILVNREEFSKALNFTSSLAMGTKALPILSCLKFVVKGNTMSITSFDGRIAVTKRLSSITCDKELSFCIPAKELASGVKLIKADELDIEINDELSQCEIKHGKKRLSLACYPIDDFPVFNMDEDMTKFKMRGDVLSNWTRDARMFVGNDDLRPVMSCMYFYIKDGEMGYCASNAHKLITDRMDYEDKDINVSALLSSIALKPINEIAYNSENVGVKIGKGSAIFANSDSAVLCILMEGAYPNFKSIIPHDFPNTSIVDKNLFNDSLMLASVAFDTMDTLILDIHGGEMLVKAENLDFNRTAEDICPCESTGDIRIGMKGGFLKDILSCVESDSVKMVYNSPNQAVVFHDDANPSKIMLLMPLRLAN